MVYSIMVFDYYLRYERVAQGGCCGNSRQNKAGPWFIVHDPEDV
jgi:hypothetical protein